MSLKLNERKVGDVTVLDCEGRIVFGDESISLRDKVKAILPNSRKIVLNLSSVNYIDSGGIGILVSLFTSARTAGGDIKLANLTKRVGDLLQITKLLTVFDVFDDEAHAVNAFKQEATKSGTVTVPEARSTLIKYGGSAVLIKLESPGWKRLCPGCAQRL